MGSAQRIYSLIDELLNDLDNSPSLRSFSTDQQQQGRKKKKKKIKVKKQKNTANKPQQKASKRATKLTKSQLPPPTLQNGIKSTLLQDMQSTYDPFQVESLWDKW